MYMLVECPVYVGEENHKNKVNTATLQLRYSFTLVPFVTTVWTTVVLAIVNII